MKKFKRLCLILFAIVLAITIIAIITLYNTNPQELERKLTELSTYLQEYAYKMNDMELPPDNLVFPEEEKLTEAQKYYFYSQLDEPAKKIYVSIESNIEKIKNGEDNIQLPASLSDDAKNNAEGKEYIAEQFQNAWDAFITDKSEYFYIDSSKVCLVTKMTTKGNNTKYEFYISKGENKNYYIDAINSKEEVDIVVQEIEQAKKQILANATGTNYQKILYVHDWIINNVKYETQERAHTSNIYGCIVNKSAICEGYARAYKYLLDELNIPCILVSGTAVDENEKTERHAWNYVYLNNNWYAVDTTWDDPIIIGNGTINSSIKYKYFLKGQATMNKDHSTSGQITKNGKIFTYPQLAIDDLN